MLSIEQRDRIAIVRMDNPPVNALALGMRTKLERAIEHLADDDSVSGIVLSGTGGGFSAGADITEFDRPAAPPALRDLILRLEQSDKPVIAAIHGWAMGGGLELALGCHLRIARRGAQFGLPEARLGILPGAGGTQRLPRLLGPLAALEMILSARSLETGEALDIGLIDAICDDDAAEFAESFLRACIDAGDVPPRPSERGMEAWSSQIADFEARSARLRKKALGGLAASLAVESVRNAITKPIEEGLVQEQIAFATLVGSAESAALRHLFFAEKQATKVDGVDRGTLVRAVEKVGIIGAGTMGAGIAMAFAECGFPVTLVEAAESALATGLSAIERNYAGAVTRGSMSADAATLALSRIAGTTTIANLADCDLLIEAVYEDLQLKKRIFTELGVVAKPGAVLATNTSWQDVNEIAQASGRPMDVVGMHFFSPANKMRLLEVVRGKSTSADVLATALDVGKRIGKIPVTVGVCEGFVGNRMLRARREDMEALMLEGADPYQIDRAHTDFGWAMGPLAAADLAGLDIGWLNRKARGQVSPIADALCEQGRFGQKARRGYYLYEAQDRKPIVDPEVTGLIEQMARAAGIKRREILADEIIERTLYPMINEGTKILEEGIAARASDIDVIWVNGYGFPAALGGPMYWAQKHGIGKLLASLARWHQARGGDHFAPSAMLQDLVRDGRGFFHG